MNQAMSHLANKSVLQGDTYNRLLEQGSHQLKKKKKKERKESSLEESKSSGENSFSLTELQCFHWLHLLLGEKEDFLPPTGQVK